MQGAFIRGPALSRAGDRVWKSIQVLGGQLEGSDLTTDESNFVAVLATKGRIVSAPGVEIRANVIEQVVTHSGPVGASFATFRRLAIHEALIVGKVDLSDCDVFPVLFDGCQFTGISESFDISRSDIKDLRITRSTFAADLRGENSRVAGNLLLLGCVIEGSANLMFTSVAGNLILAQCDVVGMGMGEISLTLDGLEVEGLLQITDTHFAGSVSIREARLRSQSVIRDTVIGSDDKSSSQLLLQKASLESELTIGPKVVLDQLMGEALRSESDLILTGIRAIENRLELKLDRVELRGGLQIFDIVSNGPLQLRGASVASLQISKSRLVAPGFNLDGTLVPGAPAEDRYALSGDGLHAAGDITLGPDFLAIGEVRLIDASVGGQIQYRRGASSTGVVLNLEHVKLASALFLDDMDPRSVVHLAAASVGGIFIDPANIPHVSLLRTDYEFINDENGRPPTAEVALDLLSRDTMMHSFVPYRRLARWFSDELGDERGARAILIAGERKTRRAAQGPLRVVDNVWRWTVGYGYAPSRAIWPFLGLVILATAFFAATSGFGRLADWATTPAVVPAGGPQPVFNPFLYALSATVPFLPDFLSSWTPSNPAVQIATVLFQVLGWLLITALVAGIVNRLRRRG